MKQKDYFKIFSKIMRVIFLFAIQKEAKKAMLHRYVSASADGKISCFK